MPYTDHIRRKIKYFPYTYTYIKKDYHTYPYPYMAVYRDMYGHSHIWVYRPDDAANTLALL